MADSRKARRAKAYKKRQEYRQNKKIKDFEELHAKEKLDDLNLRMYYGLQSKKGVMWKTKTILFVTRLFSKTVKRMGETKRSLYSRFTIMERRKKRDISAPQIEDRAIDKLITNEILKPIYNLHSIFDNGASTVGKGFHFAMRRLKKMMRDHYKLYGLEGGVLLLDIKGFFPNAEHKHIKKMHQRYFPDEDIQNELWGYVEPDFDGVEYKRNKEGKILKNSLGRPIIYKEENPEIGMPLGLEPSQQEMINYPVDFDNWLSCQKHLKTQHYMDDYAIDIPPDIVPHIRELIKEIAQKASENGMQPSPTKTRYVPYTKSFRYCKIRFRLNEDGTIVTRGSKKSAPALRRRIIMFVKNIRPLSKVEKTALNTNTYDSLDPSQKRKTFEQLRSTMQSSMSYFDNWEDGNRKYGLVKLFKEIFGFDYRDTYAYRWRQLMMDSPDYVKKVMQEVNFKSHSADGTAYKCVHSYVGMNLFKDISIIDRGEVLYVRKGILVYKNTAICTEHSKVAHEHFFINKDGMGMTRGKLISNIKEQVKKTVACFAGDRTCQWNSMLYNKTIRKYRRPQVKDTEDFYGVRWLFNDDFYQAPVKDLEIFYQRVYKKPPYNLPPYGKDR